MGPVIIKTVSIAHTKGDPEACVDRHIAGRADDRDDLEQSVVDAVGDGREFRGSVDAHEQRNAKNDNDKRAQLAAAADAQKFARKGAVKQAEAHAAQGHENERHVLRIRAVGRHTVVADAKPPVDTVLSDMFTESNSGMPPRSSRTICTTVIAIYISYKSFADFCMRGTSFAAIGPGNSARSRNIEPPSRATGAIASRKTRTPIPPIQLVMLRQSSIAGARPRHRR